MSEHKLLLVAIALVATDAATLCHGLASATTELAERLPTLDEDIDRAPFLMLIDPDDDPSADNEQAPPPAATRYPEERDP